MKYKTLVVLLLFISWPYLIYATSFSDNDDSYGSTFFPKDKEKVSDLATSDIDDQAYPTCLSSGEESALEDDAMEIESEELKGINLFYEENYKEASEYLKKGAEKGDKNCQKLYADICYRSLDGTDHPFAATAHWYFQALLGGDFETEEFIQSLNPEVVSLKEQIDKLRNEKDKGKILSSEIKELEKQAINRLIEAFQKEELEKQITLNYGLKYSHTKGGRGAIKWSTFFTYEDKKVSKHIYNIELGSYVVPLSNNKITNFFTAYSYLKESPDKKIDSFLKSKIAVITTQIFWDQIGIKKRSKSNEYKFDYATLDLYRGTNIKGTHRVTYRHTLNNSGMPTPTKNQIIFEASQTKYKQDWLTPSPDSASSRPNYSVQFLTYSQLNETGRNSFYLVGNAQIPETTIERYLRHNLSTFKWKADYLRTKGEGIRELFSPLFLNEEEFKDKWEEAENRNSTSILRLSIAEILEHAAKFELMDYFLPLRGQSWDLKRDNLKVLERVLESPDIDFTNSQHLASYLRIVEQFSNGLNDEFGDRLKNIWKEEIDRKRKQLLKKLLRDPNYKLKDAKKVNAVTCLIRKNNDQERWREAEYIIQLLPHIDEDLKNFDDEDIEYFLSFFKDNELELQYQKNIAKALFRTKGKSLKTGARDFLKKLENDNTEALGVLRAADYEVYSDPQNAHDSNIVKKFSWSLKQLQGLYGGELDKLDQIDQKCKEFSNNLKNDIQRRNNMGNSKLDLHIIMTNLQSIINSKETIEGKFYPVQIFYMVWNTIQKQSNIKFELETIFMKSLEEKGICFFGLVMRMVQSLEGFDVKVNNKPLYIEVSALNRESQIINNVLARLEARLKEIKKSSKEKYEELLAARDPYLRETKDSSLSPLLEFIESNKSEIYKELSMEFLNVKYPDYESPTLEEFNKYFEEGLVRFQNL